MTKIALAQVISRQGDPAATLARATCMVEEAAREGAGLIVFPEQFVTGWSPNVPPDSGEHLDGPLVAAFRKMARENEIAVVGSFVERRTGSPRNTAVILDACGDLLATYAKMHLFSPGGEDENYAPGDQIATFSVAGTTFGVAVCYDLRFPELFRIYAVCGTECVLVPAAWPCCRMRHWDLLIAARALENRFYVAGVNTAGTNCGIYCGGSLAADPEGTVIARCGPVEEIRYVTIDPGAVREARDCIPALSDRRSDLYQALLSKM